MYLINIPIKTKEVIEAVDGLELDGFSFKVESVTGFKVSVSEANNNYEESYRPLKNHIKNLVGGGVFFNVEKR